jgi:xanthine dehydrogenase accessory factor
MVLTEIIHTLQRERRVMLATIISTTGSTPASAFSKMLVTEGGTRLTGTVGGGCVEADVLRAASKLHTENRAAILTFHLNEDEYVQGLICGGSLDVLIEPIDATAIPLFQRLHARSEQGEDSVLATMISENGTIVSKDLLDAHNTSTGWKEVEIPDLFEELRKCLHRHQTRRIKLEGAEVLLEPIAGTPSLIIYGGGHVSKFISHAATMAGFLVTIVDDRPEYANARRFPEAKETLALDSSRAFDTLRINPSTYVVIVTRGHRYDEEILERAVYTDARYIGMIGSRRKVLTTYERLIERGVAPEQLKRVHAPMGIEIGSATPEEIGISVVAELIAVRRGYEGIVMHKSDTVKQLITRKSRRAENSSQPL